MLICVHVTPSQASGYSFDPLHEKDFRRITFSGGVRAKT
jgi:hypothetical protein